MRNAEESIELIRERSALGVKVDVITRLLDHRCCTQEDLLRALSSVETDNGVVVSMFQLPFLVRLAPGWLNLGSKPWRHGRAAPDTIHPSVYLRHVAMGSNEITPGNELMIRDEDAYAGTATFNNAVLPGDHIGHLVRTQVLMTVPLNALSRQLAEYYPTYVERCKIEALYNQVWLKAPRPHGKGKAYTTGDYEETLCRYLYRTSRYVINWMLPQYAVCCRDYEAVPQSALRSFSMMVGGGRVVPSLQKSVLVDSVRQYEPKAPRSNNKRLMKQLDSGKPWSEYEEYLLQAIRLVDSGFPNLAIVQTVVILDWMATSVVKAHIIDALEKSCPSAMWPLVRSEIWMEDSAHIIPNTRQKFGKYLPLLGVKLPGHLNERFLALMKQRDEITHRTHVKPFTIEDARLSVDAGFEIIRYVVDRLRDVISERLPPSPARSDGEEQ